MRKGGGDSVQTGNCGDTFTVTQTSTQDNDTGNNQTNLIQGDCTTDGNCTVTQTTNIDGTSQTNTQADRTSTRRPRAREAPARAPVRRRPAT